MQYTENKKKKEIKILLAFTITICHSGKESMPTFENYNNAENSIITVNFIVIHL